jgi:hypothetical protein
VLPEQDEAALQPRHNPEIPLCQVSLTLCLKVPMLSTERGQWGTMTPSQVRDYFLLDACVSQEHTYFTSPR